ncbi:MAG TPA: hypothetical protein VGK67_36395 [Myxococcales bacterium]
MIARWPLWRLSGGWAYLLLFGSWLSLAWILSRASDTAYGMSIHVSWAGPTLLFAFLFARHWALRASYSRRELFARLIGCLVACGLAAWSAVETDLAYQAMDDAPRGLLWDFNIVVAPLVGMVATLLTRLVVNPSGLRGGKKPADAAP